MLFRSKIGFFLPFTEREEKSGKADRYVGHTFHRTKIFFKKTELFFENPLLFSKTCAIIATFDQRPVGQAVKTLASHAGNMGSIPVRVTRTKHLI